MNFEFSEEMAAALDSRPDIEPKITAGSNVKQGSPKKAKRSHGDAIQGASKGAENQSEEDPHPGQTAKKSKKQGPKKSEGDVIEKCISLIKEIKDTQQRNEERRLSILERIATSLEKK